MSGTAAVNPSGTFSNAYTTTGLAPAKYYVIVQHPGVDNSLQITTKGNTGQVINRKTNATVFSFTGAGNLVDAAAVTALSNAFNAPGVDDIYTKLVFTILPANEAVPTYPGNTPAPGSVTIRDTSRNGSSTRFHDCCKVAGWARHRDCGYYPCSWCSPVYQETITDPFFLSMSDTSTPKQSGRRVGVGSGYQKRLIPMFIQWQNTEFPCIRAGPCTWFR